MKTKQHPGDRVRQIRLARDFSQAYLAQQVGATQQMIYMLETNQIKTSAYMPAIAKALNVSLDWLLSGSPMEEPPTYNQQLGVPLLDWSEVKNWCNPKECLILEKDRRFIFLQYAGPKAYALQLTNDSLVAPGGHSRSFYKGGMMVVDPEKTPNDNDYVIIQTPNATEAICRQYVQEGGSVYLKPVNSQYPTLKKDKNMKCYGVVVAYLDLLVAY